MPEEEQLARARRVGVPTPEALNAPTLDSTLIPVTTPTRPRHDEDDELPLARRAARPRRRPPPPTGPDPFALTGVLFGVVSVVGGACWLLGGPSAIVALVCGVAGLNGRSRPKAIAAVTLGVAGLAAGFGVAVSTMAMVSVKSAPTTTPVPPVWVPPVPPKPEPFLPQ